MFIFGEHSRMVSIFYDDPHVNRILFSDKRVIYHLVGIIGVFIIRCDCKRRDSAKIILAFYLISNGWAHLSFSQGHETVGWKESTPFRKFSRLHCFYREKLLVL